MGTAVYVPEAQVAVSCILSWYGTDLELPGPVFDTRKRRRMVVFLAMPTLLSSARAKVAALALAVTGLMEIPIAAQP